MFVDRNTSPKDIFRKRLIRAWVIFFATIPVGIMVGLFFGQGPGQDGVGRAIAMSFGLLVFGFIGGIIAAVLATRAANAFLPRSIIGKLLAAAPWIIWAGIWFGGGIDFLTKWLDLL